MDDEKEKITTILTSFREIVEILFHRIDLIESDIRDIKKRQHNILLMLDDIRNRLPPSTKRSIFSHFASYILHEKKTKKQENYMDKYLEFLKENPEKMILTTKRELEK